MANIAITSDAWTEISITSGTVQNISATADIELSAEQTDNSGVVLKPSEIYQWDNETIYARAVTEETGALRVVNFKKAAGGGGSYVLPAATDSTLGGVKVGANLSIDENGVLSATGGGVNYSTTEQEIGTWIDGKPLYQITIEDTMPTISGSAADKRIDISAQSPNVIVSLHGMIYRESGGDYIEFYANTDTSYRFLQYIGQSNEILVRGNGSTDSQQPIFITIQYTKATD